MVQRYVLYPGLVTCGKSGESHFIGASTLARMYGVEMRDCVVFDPDPYSRMADYKDCVHLHPEYDEDCMQAKVVAVGTQQSPDTAR